MKELNMATYIQTLQAGFSEKRTQEAAATLILDAINDQEHVIETYGHCRKRKCLRTGMLLLFNV